MDQKVKRRLIWWGTLILLFVLSYWREVLFRSVNAIMGGESTFYAKTTALPFLLDYSAQQLNQLKYILTATFTSLFIGFTYMGIHWGIQNRLGLLLAKIIYGCCILIALIIIGFGFLFLDFQTIYPFIRIIIGWLHTPLIFLFISIIVHSSNSFDKKD
tara:strand:- start:4751 stop:5224 length:474 start_codon:yes stop_codon:yes gene_type:complete